MHGLYVQTHIEEVYSFFITLFWVQCNKIRYSVEVDHALRLLDKMSGGRSDVITYTTILTSLKVLDHQMQRDCYRDVFIYTWGCT